MSMTTYFISGHLDVTPEEFTQHYVPALVDAIAGGHSFVVGDARGCDTQAQRALAILGDFVRNRVTVYHMLEKPRNLEGQFKTVGGFKTDGERDQAMTAASDKDIAWVRPGREKSGTAKNLARRDA